MKHIYIFVLLVAARTASAQKQVLFVGSTTVLTIKVGTAFSADSLVLIPGTDFTLASNTLQESATPVTIGSSTSIDRQYNFSSQITFTGTIQLYYQLSELNGNNENALLYTDSATSGSWVPEVTSTVNTGLHFVQFTASAQPFIASTASGPIVLPLSFISFTGSWNDSYPVLNWEVNQTGGSVSFQIESSVDGSSWSTVGTLGGQNNIGVDNYQVSAPLPPARNMYYRIQMTQPEGQLSYSDVVNLQNQENSNDVILVASANAVHIIFSGSMPAGIRLLNLSGQLLHTDMTGRQKYDLYGLNAGVYFLQYDLNGQWAVRKFVIE